MRLFALILCVGFLIPPPCNAQSKDRGKDDQNSPSPGYTLIAPLGSRDSYLIDMDGKVVHQWSSEYQPGNAAYLLSDGSLLRSCKEHRPSFDARGGVGGRVQRISWDGDVLWDFKFNDAQYCQHHDIEPMPNGNVLLIAWERKSRQQAIDAGRDPNQLQGNELWPETIVEIKPEGKTGGKIVWQWRLWDHLVQAHDRSKANYGQPGDHPELVDINFMQRGNSDWIHMNSVAYNEQLDQIMLSARWFNEIWIIDHSTTTEEAASHEGGKYGKGGDLLYRWGNPYAYFAGWPQDQLLFAQHDARWIPKAYPGGGNILVFNNGGERTSQPYSSVNEIKPPINDDGSYWVPKAAPFAPDDYTWSYSNPREFLSERISGAERQPNGNTLICSGNGGWVFEVTPKGKIVWEFFVSSLSHGGGRGGSGLFRAPRYPLDHPALKKLSP